MIPNKVKENPKEKIKYGVFYALKPILMLQLIFGYDYGLFRKKNIFLRVLVKYICILVVIGKFSTALYAELCQNDEKTLFIHPVHYFGEAFSVIFCYGPKIINHLKSYNRIDDLLNVNEKYYRKLKRNNIVYITLMFCVTIIYMTNLSFEKQKLKISCILFFTLDVSNILRVNFFNIIRYRARLLREKMEIKYSSEIVDKQTKINSDNDTVFIEIYKQLSDHLFDFKHTIDTLV